MLEVELAIGFVLYPKLEEIQEIFWLSFVRNKKWWQLTAQQLAVKKSLTESHQGNAQKIARRIFLANLSRQYASFHSWHKKGSFRRNWMFSLIRIHVCRCLLCDFVVLASFWYQKYLKFLHLEKYLHSTFQCKKRLCDIEGNITLYNFYIPEWE